MCKSYARFDNWNEGETQKSQNCQSDKQLTEQIPLGDP